MSIATKLQKILDSKAAIKTAIAGKGGTISDATPLDEYAQAIEDIPSGSDATLAAVIDGSVTEIDVPSGATKVQDYKFSYCQSLTRVTLPAGLTSIGAYAFQYCMSLVSITLPAGLTSIEERAFQHNYTLNGVTIPNSCITFGQSVFNGCNSLTSIVIPEGTTTLPRGLLFNTRGLTYAEFPSTLTAIETLAVGGPSSTYIFKATTPPTLAANGLPDGGSYRIYVPDASLNDYLTATNWSSYAARIHPLSEYQP